MVKLELIGILWLITLTSSTDWSFFVGKYYKKFGKCPPFFKKYCVDNNPMEVKNAELQDLPVLESGVWTPYINKTIPDHAFLTESHRSYLVKVIDGEKSTVAFRNETTKTTTFLNGSSYAGKEYESIFTFTDLQHQEDFSTELFGNYLTFRVKGRHEVTVKLLSPLQCFEISLGVITNYYIGINECLKEFSSTVYVEKGLLDSKKSRGFWVYWSKSEIVMGLEGELVPRIRMETSIIQPFYKAEYSSRKKVQWRAPSFTSVL